MQIEIFRGTAANVNSYLLIDDAEVFLIDALRNSIEAENLALLIRMTGKPLKRVLITHGHPDHFMGLRVLRNRFPGAEFLVAREGIKEDIIRHSLEMERDGWLDGNPAHFPFEGDPGMKDSCYVDPDGFEYDRELRVLPSNRLQLGSGLGMQLTTFYQPTECGHMTVLYLPAMKILFAADLVSNGMFPWLGNGVERQHVLNWINVLKQLQEVYLADSPMVYPGHGLPGEFSLLDEQIAFLHDFLSVVDNAPTQYEAVATLIRKYPDHYQREFILLNSVANFMRKESPTEKHPLANVYALRNAAGEQRMSGAFRKVL